MHLVPPPAHPRLDEQSIGDRRTPHAQSTSEEVIAQALRAQLCRT